MRLALFYVLCVQLVPALGAKALHAEDLNAIRTWLSNDGKTMQARLLDATNPNAIQFKLHDGRTANIPLSRLATPDQDLILAHQKKSKPPLKACSPP